MINISVRDNGSLLKDVPLENLADWIGHPNAVVWVDVQTHTMEEMAPLGKLFDFHPLALEDVAASHQRPKVDNYPGHVFIVFYEAVRDASGELLLHEVEFFLGHNYVVTVHDVELPSLSKTHQRWEASVTTMKHTVGTLIYAILDTVMDEYFPLLDDIASDLDELEDRVFENFSPDLMREALRLKHDLIALRRVVGPQRDVINVLLRREEDILADEAMPYIQDLYDHALRVVETVDAYREMISGVMDGFLSVQSNNINVIIHRLTIINLLFLPLAVLTGFFGMNFTMIPFDNRFLLVLALFLMVALPLALYLWLRSRGLDSSAHPRRRRPEESAADG